MSTPAAVSRLVLVPDPRAGTPTPSPVRRFRLARLRADVPVRPTEERFAHLRRSHD